MGKPKLVTMRLVGLSGVKRELAKLVKTYPAATAAALYQEGLALLAETQPRVPVDTGRLRGTGYVAPPTAAQGETPVVEVGYGTTYAVDVHERTELQHPVGEARFLANAVAQRSAGYTKRLGARIEENAARGVTVQAIPAAYPEKPTVDPKE